MGGEVLQTFNRIEGTRI